MAEVNRIGFQENLTAYGNDPARNPYINFAYSNAFSPTQPQSTIYNQTVPTYYIPQGLASVEKQSYNNDFEPRIEQGFQAQPSIINQRFITKEQPNYQIKPNPIKVGSRVGTAVPPSSPKLKTIPPPAFVQYIPYKTQVNEDYEREPVDDYRERKVAAGALELTIASGVAEHPRRYKDKDKGQFLCGKWGWIAAALLFTILLTLSLLFGLGVLGGSTKDNTKVTSQETVNNNAIPNPVVNANSNGSTLVKQQKSNKPNESGSNGSSNVSGGGASGATSGTGTGQAKGQTNVSPLPPNNGNYQRENATSTPAIIPLIPTILPSTQTNTVPQESTKTANPSTSTSTSTSPSPSTSTTNQSSSTSTATPPQTIKPTPATPNNQPATSTETKTNPSDTTVNNASSSTTTLKPTPTPTQNNTPTTTTPVLNPNSIPATPVGTPSSQTVPKNESTIPKPIVVAPVESPAPNYVGPAQYDFYPNYVLAQLAHQLGMVFRH